MADYFLSVFILDRFIEIDGTDGFTVMISLY